MPKRRALRQFKAALFETLSHPRRIELLLRLAEGEKEMLDLIDASSEAASQSETSQHIAVLVGNRILRRRVAGERVFYSLNDPSLGQVIQLIAGNEAWPVALAHPSRIEILEMLSERDHSQMEIIRHMEAEDRPQALHHLEILVTTQMVTRRDNGSDIVYSLDRNRVPEVLRLLREYFESHLVEALLMVSQMSFQHIHEEAEQLKFVLTKGALDREREQTPNLSKERGRT